jgi:hypothetical protein
VPPGHSSIGSAASNQIVISLRGVSRTHAALHREGVEITLKDLGSRNGTRVNGERVERARIVPGDEIDLGPVRLRLEREGEHDGGRTERECGGRADPPTAAAALAAFALVAQVVAGKPTRDALFLSSFSPRVLPAVMLLSSLLGMAAVLPFGRALARWPPARLVPLAVAAQAALLGLEWALCLVLPRPGAVVVYLHAALGATVMAGFWSLVNERFDPHTAKRVLGRIGAGGSLGGLCAGGLAWATAGVFPLPHMLLVLAGINALALLPLRRLAAAGPGEGRDGEPPSPAGLGQGLHLLREVSYLRLLALIVGLSALAEALLDYNLKAAAATVLAPGAALMSFFALFHTTVALLALLSQWTLARTSLEALGLAGTVAVLPGAVIAGSATAFLSPRLLTATLARGCQAALQASLFRSGCELLFTAIAPSRKRPTKAIVDVGFDRLGGLVGAALALAVTQATSAAGARALFLAAAAASVSALLLSRRLHQGYVEALADSLRSGAVRLDLADTFDSTTRSTLVQTGLAAEVRTRHQGSEAEALAAPDQAGALDPPLRDAVILRSGDAHAIRGLLSREGLDPLLTGHLIPLLGRDDVGADVLRALTRLAPLVTGQLVDALLDPSRPAAARRRLARVLRAGDVRRAVEGLTVGFDDSEFAVRHGCALALLALGRNAARPLVSSATAFAAARAEIQRAREAGRDALPERRLRHVFALLALALDREPLLLAYRALRRGHPLRGAALEYLYNVLPEALRAALWPLLGEVQGVPATGRTREELVADLRRVRLSPGRRP